MTTADLAGRVHGVRERMAAAAARSGRPASAVRLITVTKGVSVERIEEARRVGAETFGENRVQEAAEKQGRWRLPDTAWHLIGRLQTNKVKEALGLFTWIHSVDRLELVEKLGLECERAGRTMEVLMQVNVSGESSKGGFPPDAVAHALEGLARYSRLTVRGLMTIPPLTEDPEGARPVFRALRELRERLASRSWGATIQLDELSMGMSGDFEVAIEEGATLVRIGSAIFGPRK